jgi:hypothetical protein
MQKGAGRSGLRGYAIGHPQANKKPLFNKNAIKLKIVYSYEILSQKHEPPTPSGGFVKNLSYPPPLDFQRYALNELIPK